MTTIQQAAQARSAAQVRHSNRPSQRRMSENVSTSTRGAAPATVRAAAEVNADGTRGVVGVASVVEQGYEMHDMFGPYTEVVDRGAFTATLATSPLVEFTLNHNRGGGLPMAHTRNGTLTLGVSAEGLTYDATVDPTRSDVADMLKALERGDLAEASFKFGIVRGQWSPDFTEYRILEVDLNRGDVSAVNFGANPLATSQARALDAEGASVITQAIGQLSALCSIADELQETLAAYVGATVLPEPSEPNEAAAGAARPARRASDVVPDAEIAHRSLPD